jgi:hypothetical protein
MAVLAEHFSLRVTKDLHSDKRFSDFGRLSFLFQRRESYRVWFNYTFMDHQLWVAWEADPYLQFMQKIAAHDENAGKMYLF